MPLSRLPDPRGLRAAPFQTRRLPARANGRTTRRRGGRAGARLRARLRPDDHWVGDAWVVDDGSLYHLYHLQAPHSLGDREKRHVNATIGRATSRDLVDWEVLGTTFGPAESGFDDPAIWTGSAIHDGSRWRMFYTAASTAGHHIYDQRIGALVFTCHPDEMTPERRSMSGECCTWSVPSPGLLGPWDTG